MMRARLLVPIFTAASCAALAGIGDGFGLGDNGGFDGATGIDGAAVTGPVAPTPTFDLTAGSTTPNDLSDTLSVNGTSMTLALACDAQGVSGTSWVCRDGGGSVTLSEAGTGSSPSTTVLSPYHAHDASERVVAYQAGKRHDGASSSVADLTTDDFAIEYVGKLGSTSAAVILDKGSVGTEGWRLSQVGTSQLVLQLRTASTTTSINSPTGHALSFVHALAFVDRNEASTNGAIHYANGAAGTGVDVSARSASLSNASTVALGANSGGTANNNTIASIRLWRCSGCFAGGATNPAQWAPIARARAAVAWGVSPAIAAGIAGPTTLTRATLGHIDVVDGSTRQLYVTGSGAPRVSRRTHSGGTAVAGYLSEPASTNLALQSQTLGTTWTAITAGDNVLADAFAGADLTTTGDNVVGNNSAAEHGLRQAITVTAATHTFSAWARAGSQNFAVLRNATVANGAAWFDVATCTSASCVIGEDCAAAVDTVQAGVIQARAQRWPVDTTGDGVADVNLCRVSISYTGTAAPHNHDLMCAPSDNVLTYTDADATADCGFWGVRVEAFPTMTSYLATTTGSVVRNADDVRYDGASHYTGSPSTMDVAVLCPNFNTEATSTAISVGTGAANYARLGVDAANDRGYGEATVTTQQWSIIAASGDVSDGAAHSLRQTMATNNVTAYVDGVSIGTDATATLPTAASSFLYFGTTGSTAAAPACLLSRVRLWSSLVAP
jgi:hypothetical protein